MPTPILKRSGFYLTFALVLLFAAATALYFHDRSFRGLSNEALDSAQLARNIFRGEGFSTNLLPTEAPTRSAGARGFNPDLRHAPLFPLFLGGIFAVAGERDGVMAAFTIGLYLVSAALLFVLAWRLTAHLALAAAAVAAFALSIPVLSLADSGQPQALSGCFLLLALLALTPKIEAATEEEQRDDVYLEDDDSGAENFDAAADDSPADDAPADDAPADDSPADAALATDAPADEALPETEENLDENAAPAPALSPKNYFVAGLMAALCYLSDPLALIFLVPLCLLWGRGDDGWKRPNALAFLLGFVLFATPWWIRNLRLTGNPLYSEQWLAFGGQGFGLRALAANVRRGIGGFFYGVASIPHLYLMPFIVVAAWMNPLTPALSRFKSATLVTLVLTVLALSLLGRGEATALVPLAPLLTLVALTTFKQIVSDAITHRTQSGINSQGVGKTLLLGFLTVFNLRILKAEILARQSYQAQVEKETGRPALDGGRWARRKVQQAQAFALLGLILALPLIFFQPQPAKTDFRALLEPLSQLVPPERAIMTDVPQLVAWYNDRKVMPLPERVNALPTIATTPKIGAIYLSGQSGANQPMPRQWQQVYQIGLNLPDYQKVTAAGARNVVYLKQPTFQEARQAVGAKPRDGAAYLSLGQALLEKRQFRDALRAFTAAARLQPTSSAPFLGAAQAQMALRNPAGARAQFRRALQVEPRSIAALLGAAQIAQVSGKTAQAVPLYQRVLADDPEHPIALNNLAQLYADEGRDLHRALEMARRAAARNPQNGSILDTLGWVCYRIGYRREALSYLQRAAQLSPRNQIIAAHLKQAQASAARR